VNKHLSIAAKLLEECRKDHEPIGFSWYAAISTQIELSRKFYSEIEKENQQLKSDNEALNKQKVMLRNDDLSRQIKNLRHNLSVQQRCNQLIADNAKKLQEENQQLKAQLQNRDNNSQVDTKPKV
jgi:hypothetical protein